MLSTLLIIAAVAAPAASLTCFCDAMTHNGKPYLDAKYQPAAGESVCVNSVCNITKEMLAAEFKDLMPVCKILKQARIFRACGFVAKDAKPVESCEDPNTECTCTTDHCNAPPKPEPAKHIDDSNGGSAMMAINVVVVLGAALGLFAY